MDNWSTLRTYFQSTKNFLTNHHIDSYDDFVTHKIHDVIENMNPIRILKIVESLSIEHHIEIWIGDVEEATEKSKKQVYLSNPTIVEKKTKKQASEQDKQRIMYPNEARLRDLTYISDLSADIRIKYVTQKNGETIRKKSDLFQNVRIGAIPIMLQSKLCVLRDQPPDMLRQMGECKYDQGGYFIIDGKEKVIVAQERTTTNRLIVSKSSDPKWSYIGMIRCISGDASFPKTINFNINSEFGGKLGDIDRNKYSIVINLPNFTDPDITIDESKKNTSQFRILKQKSRVNIPLFVLFRALGIESDKEILEMILQDLGDAANKEYLQFLRWSVISNMDIYTQSDAFMYLARLTSYKEIDTVKLLLANDLFPNIECDFRSKAMYLAYNVYQLIRVALGQEQVSDRDNYIYKRVDVSGFLVANLFRDYYNQFKNNIRSEIDHIFHYQNWNSKIDITPMITKNNTSIIFSKHIIENGLIKSLKGKWGRPQVDEQKSLAQIKEGIVQDLSRISYLDTMSHLRRVKTPLDSTSKVIGPHQLHSSQWGIMCPCETPDGGSTGLLKNLSILCRITQNNSVHDIQKCLLANNLILISDVLHNQINLYTKIFVNMSWVGVHKDPHELYVRLKLFKRNGYFDILTSISWNISNNEIIILTESGRCCRPLLVVENGKIKLDNWNGNKNDFNSLTGLTNSKYDDDRFDNIATNVLEENAAPIEYIDVEEQNYSYIAIDRDDLLLKKRANYCEIHPSTIFSIVTLQIPLSNHNQAPRNIFSGSQGKQAIGVYASNFNDRVDTISYLLHYPQKPIVSTKYQEYFRNNSLPHGENVIVAIQSCTGYNQDDAIIFNKSSVERGMFNVTSFKSVIDTEERDRDTDEWIKFENPKEILNKGFQLHDHKWANYSTLDQKGFPQINCKLQGGDAVIGKTKHIPPKIDKSDLYLREEPEDQYFDRTMIADKNFSGTVDRVLVYYTSEDNTKRCKIRLRKFRQPELGDKFACYSDDTEILTDKGWIKFPALDDVHDVKVATMVNGGLLYQEPIEIQKYRHIGKMYQVSSNQIELLVTENHRMYTRNRSGDYEMDEAEDLFGKIRHYKKNVDAWEPHLSNIPEEFETSNNKITHFIIPFTDDSGQHRFPIREWLTFFGIWMAEGHASRDVAHGTRFAANKPRVKQSLDQICNTLGLNVSKVMDKKSDNDLHSWRIYDTSLTTFLQPLSVGSIYKTLPDWVWFLDRELCEVLIDGLLLGDGDYATIARGRFGTCSWLLADDFQRLCLHAGYSTNKTLSSEACTSSVKRSGEIITQNTDYYKLSVITKQNEPKVNKYKYCGKQNDSWVDYDGYVHCCTVPRGNGVIYVRRKGFACWSGNSRHGQKGTIGALMKPEDMPFSASGVIPDIIINPHGIPSRMTVAHLLECLLGKAGCNLSTCVDATPFDNKDYSELYKKMQDECGLEKHGNEILYNGRTGEQIPCAIFVGVIYYERLKHMVADKINYRDNHNPKTLLTRQPTQGRGNNGGIRMGEMETWCVVAQNIQAFLRESFMERSDKFTVYLDNNSGQIGLVNEKLNIWKPFKWKNNWNFSRIEIPYAFKLLTQELAAFGIKFKFLTKNSDPSDQEDQEIF